MLIMTRERSMGTPTVAEALCHALRKQGVSLLFGYPGGAILPFYDALYRLGFPRHVLIRHEQAAAHAADGYARATGQVGVCVATSGPGATNLVTGLATAMMDSVPMVAITGQVPIPGRGQDYFQEADILGITMPVTKHGFQLDDPAELPSVIQEAFRIAASRRPGPVLIDIPKDVQNAPCPTEDGGDHAVDWIATAATIPPEEELDRAAELLNKAERPVIMAGRGVILSGMADALRTLAEAADLPVTTTLLGLDGFLATHPLALGLPGMHGTVRANMSIQHADVILGLGLRFDDRVVGRPGSFAPRATIIHADISPVIVGRSVSPAVRLIGDLRYTLPALARRIAPSRRRTWLETLRQWPRAAEPTERWSTSSGPLTGRTACQALARRIGMSGAIVATDVGQHQMWLAQELREAAPGTHLTSGGLGTMGYALPAALGAALGCPDRPTWVVAGDGGFQMNLQELATVAQERIPLRMAVVNNGFLGMVRQWQELFFERRYSAVEISGPDLVVLAKAYGIPARAVSSCDELADMLGWAENVAGPVLLDLQVVQEENVYPMVPTGAAIDEMVTTPQPQQSVVA
jgi:acetolactate synthase-1/2/3 large subunit